MRKRPDMDSRIAIIGMGCHFPGADDIYEFWDMLKQGTNAVTKLSDKQLRQAGISKDQYNQNNYIRYRGLIEEQLLFDDLKFFNIGATDREYITSQTRALLRTTWQALEDANIQPQQCPKRTSIFAGAIDNMRCFSKNPDISPMSYMHGIKTLTYEKSLASVVAYQLGLQGAAVNLYTGCSTSLVAVTQAIQNLLLNHSDLAIAGAVFLETPQTFGYQLETDSILSSDGLCRTFDQKASGSALSHGVGVVILKRFQDALKDKDNIHAIIENYATNNDGKQKAGFLAPGITGQYECIKDAWDEIGIDYKDVAYIEAHGSATVVGDPMEFYSLNKVFKGKGLRKNQCGLGSVKSNIGHTTVASGMAALIKTSLILRYRSIVPTIHFETINSNINVKNSPFYIATENKKLSRRKKNLYAGVSNFGFGGTNAHLVLKNTNHGNRYQKQIKPTQLITISAVNQISMDRLIDKYIRFFSQTDEVVSEKNLPNICYTANIGRTPLNHRTIIVFKPEISLVQQLKTIETPCDTSIPKEIVFMLSKLKNFTPGTMKILCFSEPNMRIITKLCLKYLSTKMKADVKRLLFDSNMVCADQVTLKLAIFIFEYSILSYLKLLGVKYNIFAVDDFRQLIVAAFLDLLPIKQCFNFIEDPELILTGSLFETIKHHPQIQLLKNQVTSKENTNKMVIDLGKVHDTYELTEIIGKLWMFGSNINWNIYYPTSLYKMSLPTLPWVYKNDR